MVPTPISSNRVLLFQKQSKKLSQRSAKLSTLLDDDDDDDSDAKDSKGENKDSEKLGKEKVCMVKIPME